MIAPDLELALRPSRVRRAAAGAALALGLLVAPLQALRLEAPWPLLLLPALALLPRFLPEAEARHLRLGDDRLVATTAAGPRGGRRAGRAAITALAIELPVRWDDGGRERLVVWRDAVDDPAYRRLARSLRRR